mmetsp:Transcript_8547/g.16477  ORF Transcript_8547/g.16477 Transcript_8547/m.16477 type:complete len:175 (+) Transcript_8547:1967-2491(+)
MGPCQLQRHHYDHDWNLRESFLIQEFWGTESAPTCSIPSFLPKMFLPWLESASSEPFVSFGGFSYSVAKFYFPFVTYFTLYSIVCMYWMLQGRPVPPPPPCADEFLSKSERHLLGMMRAFFVRDGVVGRSDGLRNIPVRDLDGEGLRAALKKAVSRRWRQNWSHVAQRSSRRRR